MNYIKKVVLIAIVSVIVTFFIYEIFKNDKISFIALGDSIAFGINPYNEKSYSYNDYLKDYYDKNNILNKFYNEFIEIDQRTSDLINMINNNETKKVNNKKNTIQQALVKSDLITLSIGNYDLFNHLGITNGGIKVKDEKELNDYFISMFTDLNELLKTIRKFSSAKIVVVGFYNPQINSEEKMINTFEYLDDSYRIIAEKNGAFYISINHEISSNINYIENPNSIHFNYKGHKYISDKIIEVIKNFTILN